MSDQLYEILSLGMRYWFVLLGVLIVARSFLWLRRDRRDKHERIRRLPDAGMIGQLVVERGSESLPEGTALPLPHEGFIGCLRSSDVFLPTDSVAREHAYFVFHPGQGLEVRPMRGCVCVCDGVERTRKNAARQPLLLHGSRIDVGDVSLRLSFFAGVDVGDAPPLPGETPQTILPEEALREPPAPPAWTGEAEAEDLPRREKPDNPWVPR